MLSLNDGKLIGQIEGGELDGQYLFISPEENQENEICCGRCGEGCIKKKCCGGCNLCCYGSGENDDIGDEIDVNDGKIYPMPTIDERMVYYVAGPSGSGKSTYASHLISGFKSEFPKKRIYVFSRTDPYTDPSLAPLNPIYVECNEELIETPIDITSQLDEESLILFDDCNTIQNDKIRKAIEKLMGDILEVGRKLGIWIIITNHLVIPNERKIARTILNEMQSLTVFPKSGSQQQIKYVLEKYYGINKKQIEDIMNVPSRWITIFKNYPMTVMHEHGAFILN